MIEFTFSSSPQTSSTTLPHSQLIMTSSLSSVKNRSNQIQPQSCNQIKPIFLYLLLQWKECPGSCPKPATPLVLWISFRQQFCDAIVSHSSSISPTFPGSLLFLFPFYTNKLRIFHLKHLPLILQPSLIWSHIFFPIYSKTYLKDYLQSLSIPSFPILFQSLLPSLGFCSQHFIAIDHVTVTNDHHVPKSNHCFFILSNLSVAFDNNWQLLLSWKHFFFASATFFWFFLYLNGHSFSVFCWLSLFWAPFNLWNAPGFGSRSSFFFQCHLSSWPVIHSSVLNTICIKMTQTFISPLNFELLFPTALEISPLA